MFVSQRPWSCSLGTTEDLGPFVKSWVLCFLSWVETLRVAKPVLWHLTCFQLCSRGCQLWLPSRGIWCDPKAQTGYQRTGARVEAHLLLWLLSRWFTGAAGVEACVFQALPALFWPYLTNRRLRGEIKPNQRGWPETSTFVRPQRTSFWLGGRGTLFVQISGCLCSPPRWGWRRCRTRVRDENSAKIPKEYESLICENPLDLHHQFPSL